MSGGGWHVLVKRFRPGESIVTTELRFLRPGDIFWHEKNGKPSVLPEEAFRFCKSSNVYLVATSTAIWAREKSGKKRFAGLKFRAATDTEVRLVAYAVTQEF